MDSDQMLAEAHQACADLPASRTRNDLGRKHTSLTFALSDPSRELVSGDEIVLSRLEMITTPWVLAARDRGVEVKTIDVDPSDCTLRLEQYRENHAANKTGSRGVSNAVGTINPVEQICKWASEWVPLLSTQSTLPCML